MAGAMVSAGSGKKTARSGATPVIAATAASFFAAAASYAVTTPAGIAAGDLLFGVITIDSDTANPSLPAGWTQLWSLRSGTLLAGTGFARIANGSEGASISIGTSDAGSHKSEAVIHRITGAFNEMPTVGTAVEVTSTSAPDPPSVVTGWAVANNLFIACHGRRSDSGTQVTVYPTNYATDNSDNRSDGTTTGCANAFASRALAATSDDPGAFTLASATRCISQTVVVSPR